MDHARERRSRFDEVQALDDLEAATDSLETELPVMEPGLATIGFCMGGTLAIDLAARKPTLKTVSYYGFPGISEMPKGRAAPTPLALIDQLRGPILGFWGDQDEVVGMDTVETFDRELASRSIPHEFHIYEGVGHGFMAASELDPDHEAFDAASDAWSRTLEFLRIHLS